MKWPNTRLGQLKRVPTVHERVGELWKLVCTASHKRIGDAELQLDHRVQGCMHGRAWQRKILLSLVENEHNVCIGGLASPTISLLTALLTRKTEKKVCSADL